MTSSPQNRDLGEASVEVAEWRRTLRPLFLFGIPTLVLLYVAAIVLGALPDDRRLNTGEVIIVFAAGVTLFAALWPEIMERLTKVKLGSVEFELEELGKKQREQDANLDDIRFVLTLLLPLAERKHLENLWAGFTQHYEGNNILRTELRKLRALHLIENLQPIQDIKDGAIVDLKDYVRLTDDGRRYLERINRES